MEENLALVIVGFIVVMFLGFAVGTLIADDHETKTAPCSEFSSWPIKDVPARCVTNGSFNGQ